MILKCNPNASFTVFKDSTIQKQWLCRIPDRKGNHYQVTIPEDIYQFIQLFDGIKPLSDIKNIYCEYLSLDSEQWNKLELLLEEFLKAKYILINSMHKAQFVDDVDKKAAYMQLQIPVFTPNIVNFFSHLLQGLYQKYFAYLTLLFILISQVYFYLSIEPKFFYSWSLTSLEQIQVISLVGLGLLFHEFGHAAAAYKYGCRRVTIGLGWYICFLVFYADLSEAWKLSRKQRVLVDSGGMYFQAIFTSILVIEQYQTNSAVLFYSILMLNFSFIWNLNPFFRMDGYWLASDILGISNLRTATYQEFYRIWDKYINNNHVPYKSVLTNKAQKGLIFYTISSGLFFCWMTYVLGERLLLLLVDGIQIKVDRIASIEFIKLGWLDLIVFFVGTLFQMLMIYFCFYFLFNMARNTIMLVQKYLG